MTTVVLTGTAPDGRPLTVSVDLSQHRVCPAAYGTGVRTWCTLPRDHPGPWHVATTDRAIIKVWPVREEQGTRTGDVMNQQVTYQELFEKYARREQRHNIATIVSSAVAIIGLAGSVLALRELKADRAAVRAAAPRRAGGHP